MIGKDDEAEARLVFEIKNTKPVELSDLVAAFGAISRQFEREVDRAAGALSDGKAKLYIAEIRGGSIIAELSAIADQASFLTKYVDLLAGFVTHFNELVAIFLGKGKPDAEEPSQAEMRDVAQILEPIARDGAAQFNIVAKNGSKVTVNHFTINSSEANAVQNGIRRRLARNPEAATGIHRKETMTLFQARGGQIGTQIGHKAIIESLSSRPIKLIFANEDVEQAVLRGPDNPFEQVFVVDVHVGTVGGKPATYKVTKVHDVFERPDD